VGKAGNLVQRNFGYATQPTATPTPAVATAATAAVAGAGPSATGVATTFFFDKFAITAAAGRAYGARGRRTPVPYGFATVKLGCEA